MEAVDKKHEDHLICHVPADLATVLYEVAEKKGTTAEDILQRIVDSLGDTISRAVAAKLATGTDQES